jgi:hypothetical protein
LPLHPTLRAFIQFFKGGYGLKLGIFVAEILTISLFAHILFIPFSFYKNTRGMFTNRSIVERTGSQSAAHYPSHTLQLKKMYVKYGNNGDIKKEKENYKLKKNEEPATKKEYQTYLINKNIEKKSKSFAPVVKEKLKKSNNNRLKESDLLFRGMSVNNISNFQEKKNQKNGKPIFTVNNPDGTASETEHIEEDHPDSPFLSFETSGLNVSAGKYAPKPVDEKNRPIGVKKLETGFLKQEKSYTQENMEKYSEFKHIGMVGGIEKGYNFQDFSTEEKVKKLKSQKAKNLAIADKEVLVTPGKDGIKNVPFLAKIKKVTADYFNKNITNQTSKKALGFHNDNFYKIQIVDSEDSKKEYFFDVRKDFIRQDDESEDEMSEIDEMNFDFSEEETEDY